MTARHRHERDAPAPPTGRAAARAGYEGLGARDAHAAGAANAQWWSASARAYADDHGDSLGDVALQWGPEGLREDTAHLLGPLEDLRRADVLEIGAGGAQGSRWLRSIGVAATACDVAEGMLATAARIDARTGIRVPAFVADARALPLANDSTDVVFTAYGAIPFVADAERVHAEVARVLRPGGRWVFSVTHPIRWAFPDDPGPGGLTAERSYFDRRPYVERDERGRPLYAEFHRTLGDHVRDLAGAGFVLADLVEPEWPDGRATTWGGWSPLRGALLPGTAIFVCRLPA